MNLLESTFSWIS